MLLKVLPASRIAVLDYLGSLHKDCFRGYLSKLQNSDKGLVFISKLYNFKTKFQLHKVSKFCELTSNQQEKQKIMIPRLKKLTLYWQNLCALRILCSGHLCYLRLFDSLACHLFIQCACIKVVLEFAKHGWCPDDYASYLLHHYHVHHHLTLSTSFSWLISSSVKMIIITSIEWWPHCLFHQWCIKVLGELSQEFSNHRMLPVATNLSTLQELIKFWTSCLASQSLATILCKCLSNLCDHLFIYSYKFIGYFKIS